MAMRPDTIVGHVGCCGCCIQRGEGEERHREPIYLSDLGGVYQAALKAIWVETDDK